jgi:hypothetical protein
MRIRSVSSRPRRCRAVLAAAIFVIVLGRVEAGVTITALSASLVDVKTAIAVANDGDTVVIPAGTASWTSTVTITKGITLTGATTVNTTGAGGANVTGSANDQTIIVDDIPRVGGQAPILSITLGSAQSFRISGITLRASTTTTASAGGGQVRFGGGGGGSNTIRIDHCHFDGLYGEFIHVYSGNGVIDHCLMDGKHACSAVLFGSGSWGGGSNAFGDGAWADYPSLGSGKFMFIEDCILNNTASPLVQTNCNLDTYQAGRYVARHNTFNDCLANTHGTESGGRSRAARAQEIYNNTFQTIHLSGATAGQLRGGTLLIHDNAYIGSFTSGMGLRCYRELATWANWGCATGVNPLDVNDPANRYATGTVRATTSTTMSDSTASWTPGQWVGYMLYNSTNNLGSEITANTSTQITFALSSDGVSLSFSVGNTYQINKVLVALDQVGRGKGDLMSGVPPINTTTGTASQFHQAQEPVYSWNNTLNGANVDLNNYGDPTIKANRDYYNLGGGFGSSTPSSVSATYVAALNGSNYAGTYTYPHPLVTGALAVPAAPNNLRVTGP